MLWTPSFVDDGIDDDDDDDDANDDNDKDDEDDEYNGNGTVRITSAFVIASKIGNREEKKNEKVNTQL